MAPYKKKRMPSSPQSAILEPHGSFWDGGGVIGDRIRRQNAQTQKGLISVAPFLAKNGRNGVSQKAQNQ